MPFVSRPAGIPDQGRGLDFHARAHRRGDGDALEVGALGAGRPRLLNRVGEGLDVFDELLGLERGLADAGVDDARPSRRGTRPSRPWRRGPRRRRPWSPCRPWGSASGRADPAPYRAGRPAASCRGWRCSGRSRSCRPGHARPDPRRRRCRRPRPWPRRPWRRGRTPPTRTVRPEPFGRLHDAADHLVGVARVDAEVHRDLDGLVELGLGPLLDQLHGLVERVELVAVDAFAGRLRALSDMCHRSYPATWRPIERAEPSTIFIAASIVVAVEVLHLLLGDLADLRARHRTGGAAARGLGAGLDVRRLLEEEGHRRGASSRR